MRFQERIGDHSGKDTIYQMLKHSLENNNKNVFSKISIYFETVILTANSGGHIASAVH